jgi:hypothetical protein
MSTRSGILMELENGQYKGIYCHWDGYLTHNGAMLIDHYSNREKVEKLLSFGDLSLLRPEIELNPNSEHTFDNPQDNVCVFYGRDRGEEKQDAIVGTLSKIMEANGWIEFFYIFTKNNEWKYCEVGGETDNLNSVKEALDDIFQKWGIKRPKGIYGFYDKKQVQELLAQELQATTN